MRNILPRLGVMILCSVFLAGCSLLNFRQKAGLQVLTNDVPANLYVDGKLLGQSPYINKELPAGDVTLEIRPTDTTLTTYQTKVSLKGGLLTVVLWKPNTRPETSGGVLYEMEKASNSKQSQLSIVTIPDGAIVRVDGQAKGFAPILVDSISSGEHEYEITLPSYETQKHTINVLEGYRMDVTSKLAKIDYDALQQAAASASPSATTQLNPTPTPIASTKSASFVNPIAATVIAPPKIRVLSTGYIVEGKEVLKVRSTPATNGPELGLAPVGGEYPYKGQVTNGWYQVNFNGQSGWISQRYAQLITK